MANNEFPLDYVFPSALKTIVDELDTCQGFPKEFTGCSMLYAISVAMGNNFHVKVRNGFIMNCSLYIVLVGPAGSKKSQPLKFAIKPLQENDKRTYRDFVEQKTKYDSIKKQSEKERMEQGISDPLEPRLIQLIVNDSTMESLQETLKYNPKGIGVWYDEWRDWYLNLDRFNSGSNKPKYLSLWDGSSISVNRKGGLPIRIDNPFVSLAGTTQTELLNDLYQGENAVSGFLDRFLICNPKDLKRKSIGDNELSVQIELNWHKLINDILQFESRIDEFGVVTPRIIPYARECRKYLDEFEIYINGSINQERSPAIKSYYSKVETYTHRFALIIQMIAHYYESESINEISVTSLLRARKLMDYFSNNIIEILKKEEQFKIKKICKNNDEMYFWYTNLNPEFRTIEAKELYHVQSESGDSDDKSFTNGDRKVADWLKNTNLFTKMHHGYYSKNF